MTGNVLSTQEVAARLGISRRAVIKRVQTGTLPVMAKLPGPTGAWLFDSKEIARLAESNNRRGELDTREGVS